MQNQLKFCEEFCNASALGIIMTREKYQQKFHLKTNKITPIVKNRLFASVWQK